jgi:hypothetical protein
VDSLTKKRNDASGVRQRRPPIRGPSALGSRNARAASQLPRVVRGRCGIDIDGSSSPRRARTRGTSSEGIPVAGSGVQSPLVDR